MKNTIIAGILLYFGFASYPFPAHAKSFWLKCGNHVINLNSDKEQFTTEYFSKMQRGRANFYPNEINFRLNMIERADVEYTINRKTLSYTVDMWTNFSDIVGWLKNDTPFEKGKCKIIPSPTAGNKI